MFIEDYTVGILILLVFDVLFIMKGKAQIIRQNISDMWAGKFTSSTETPAGLYPTG